MDKTTMEKPERRARNFSILVPDHVYQQLNKMSALTGISLGATCRQLLEIVPYPLYTKLQAQAYKERITVTALCRRILEKATNSK